MSNINDMGLPQGLPVLGTNLSDWIINHDVGLCPCERCVSWRQRPREMTAADLGLHKLRCEYSMDQLCMWWDHTAAPRLFKPDAPYAFWLGAEG